jgi:hypothetical protein
MGGCLFDIASWSASPSIAAVPISPEIDVTCHKANMRLGVHEFLLKPISPKMLAGPASLDPGRAAADGADRQYYVPEPRGMVSPGEVIEAA